MKPEPAKAAKEKRNCRYFEASPLWCSNYSPAVRLSAAKGIRVRSIWVGANLGFYLWERSGCYLKITSTFYSPPFDPGPAAPTTSPSRRASMPAILRCPCGSSSQALSPLPGHLSQRSELSRSLWNRPERLNCMLTKATSREICGGSGSSSDPRRKLMGRYHQQAMEGAFCTGADLQQVCQCATASPYDPGSRVANLEWM